MDKLSNFINFLKYGNLEFDLTKNFFQIIKELCDFNLYESEEYLKNPGKKGLNLVSKKNLISVKSKNKERVRVNIEEVDNEPDPILNKMIKKIKVHPPKQTSEYNAHKYDFSHPETIIHSIEDDFTKLNLIHLKKNDKNNKEKLKEGNITIATKNDMISSQRSRTVVKRLNEEHLSDNIMFDDIDMIKKKKKLLEFVILQKARNKYFLTKNVIENNES